MIALDYVLRSIILRSKIMNILMNIDICKLLSRRIFTSSYCQPLCMSRLIRLVSQQIFSEHLVYASTISAVREFNVKLERHKNWLQLRVWRRYPRRPDTHIPISHEMYCGCVLIDPQVHWWLLNCGWCEQNGTLGRLIWPYVVGETGWGTVWCQGVMCEALGWKGVRVPDLGKNWGKESRGDM